MCITAAWDGVSDAGRRSTSASAVSLGDDRSELVVEDAGLGFDGPGVVRRGKSTSGSTGLGLDIVARTAERYGGSFRIGESHSGGAPVGIVLRGIDGSDPEETPNETL